MRKTALATLFSAIFILCGFTLVACHHSHTYSDKWSKDENFHWHAATCEHTDELSDKDKHSFDNYKCSLCGYELLEYELNNDEQSYSVIGIGGYSQAELEIPKTYNNKPITSISDFAFSDCSILTSVRIDNNVKSIGNGAFYGCGSLESIVLPQNITRIGESMFDTCSNLSSISIPEKVTSIDTSAFKHCESLGSIIIPDSVTYIGDTAFADCGSVTKLSIGSGLDKLGNKPFAGCAKLEIILVSAENETYKSIDNCLIDITTKMLVVGCKASKIPTDGSVTILGNGALCSCSELTNLLIPKSIERLESYALQSCVKLTDIYYEGSKSEWSAIVKEAYWDDNTGNYTIHCSDGDIKKAE